MALFNESELRNFAQTEALTKSMSAARLLEESVSAASQRMQFDIFLSHSFHDQELILGLKLALEQLGYSVYVDWVEDRQLDRSKVTKHTARTLRERMKKCKCLFYAATENSQGSAWMPWELGYLDGHKNRSAILPIEKLSTNRNDYKGKEYLGVYPYVITAPMQGSTKPVLWIFEDVDSYVDFDSWLKGQEPRRRS